ncbi:MAG: TetR/AcrR family transcriptional regulator [Micromonosporaceae bacterium]
MDDRLLDSAVAVLDEHGFAGLTLERVAEAAGKSRVTLWRQGVTQEALIDGLLARLTRDYRDAMWPAMAEAGTGAERLREALAALLHVADRHLHLLAVSDDVFHQAADRVLDVTGRAFSFLDPFTAALRAGHDDGTLTTHGFTVDDLADTVFNTVCWGYVHLRHRHEWTPERARPVALALALAGLGAPAA